MVACFHVEVSILGSEGHTAIDLFPSNLEASFTCSFAKKWKEKKKDLNDIDQYSKLTRGVCGQTAELNTFISEREKELSAEEDSLSCYIEDSKVKSKNSVFFFVNHAISSYTLFMSKTTSSKGKVGLL